MGLSFSHWRAGGYANAAVPRLADPARLHGLAGQTMGTTWSLRFDNPRMLPLEAVRETVEAALARVVGQMSHWVPDSAISRFNRAPPGSQHTLPPEFAQVLACALRWAEDSAGAIDPTVGALVACWGFGPEAESGLPDAAARDAARKRTGWWQLAFNAADGTLVQPGGFVLDLSGIAKGFAVDHGTEALLALGLRDFLFEIGGELRGAGQRPGGQPWQVLVDGDLPQPLRVALDDRAIATSGDRWHRREHGGRRWSHTIDPRSGEPAPDTLASVTVLHPHCMQADALATVLTVLGPDEGFAFAQARDIEALFIARGDGPQPPRATSAWSAQRSA